MDIERWQPGDEAGLRGCQAALAAATDIDDPDGPRMTAGTLNGWLRRGFDGDPVEAWYLPGETPGSVLGWYRLQLPDLENRDRALMLIVTDPAQRRRGLGRALLRHAAERAAGAGRTTLNGETRDGSAGEAFAAAVGAKPGIGETLRRLDLRSVPGGTYPRVRAEAAAAATGYSVVLWAGVTPPEHAEGLARVVNAFEDAPRDAGVEAENWDSDRIRERSDLVVRLMKLRSYTMAARHDASGELAAMTSLNIAPEDPRWVHQGLTAVTREHRGHRLGLLLKAAMLEWLAENEPAAEMVQTGNASDNAHMIAVNDQLGYVPALPEFHSCELDVAAVLGS